MSKAKPLSKAKPTKNTSDTTLPDTIREFFSTPEDELLNLPTDLGRLAQVTRGAADYARQDLASALFETAVLHKLSGLLAQARKDQGLSVRDMAERLGVKHPRVVQLEQQQNLEIATLYQYAQALGYGVEIALIPRAKGRKLVARAP
jgi:ribosome-binding protein aMBF1 (putative translation factor)